jgi:hypothetical protein
MHQVAFWMGRKYMYNSGGIAMRRLSIALVIISSIFAGQVQISLAKYSGGSGTADDPYLISTPQQMNSIGVNPSDLGKCFMLTSDIDMSTYTGTQYNIIGNSTTKFTGTFDGNGHIIRNLNYTTTASVNNVGLFGYIYSGAEIKNLWLVDISIQSYGDCIGGLVGRSEYSTQIISCYIYGSINGGSNVGGLIGYTEYGSISCCYTSCTINGEIAGGLVGWNAADEISSCYSTSSISGTGAIGGLVGMHDYFGSIKNCCADAQVSDTGGITSVGGLVGQNSSTNNSAITYCYSVGSVHGQYPTMTGGLVGINYGTRASYCFWDTQTSGQTTSAGGTDKTTSQMKTKSTFTNAGWDFVGENANGSEDLWRIIEGDSYPIIIFKTPKPNITPSGGTFNSSVQVSLSCAAAATIRYTTNGSDPTSGSLLYSSPFTVSNSCTVKARAFKSDYRDSDVAIAYFTITGGTWHSESVNWRVDYENDWNKEGTVTKPGATAIRLHFSEINVEGGYDYLYSDAGDDWTGSYTAVTSSSNSGNSIRLTLTSDVSNTGYFIIDRVEYQGTSTGPASKSGDLLGSYIQTGGLRIDIIPQEAIDAGAHWRRVGTTTWRDSGTIEDNIPVGTYEIEFMDIPGWNTPSNQSTEIYNGLTTYAVPAEYTLQQCALPSAPTGVSASKATYTDHIRVTWNFVSGATTYEIWKNTSDNSGSATKIPGDQISPYDDYSGTNDTTYYWIKAKNSCGTSSFSSSDYGYFYSCTAPPTPTGVTATKGTYSDCILIYWDYAYNTYEVWRSTSNNSNSATKIIERSNDFYWDYSITFGTTYYYWIKAKDNCGTSDFSLPDYGFTPDCIIPSPPSGVSASKGNYTDRIHITWSSVSGATGYEVWRNTINNSSSATKKYACTNYVSSFYDYNVELNVTYYYWIKATNICGASNFSLPDYGYLYSPCQKPSASENLSASKGTYTDHIQVSWDTIRNATSYDIWRGTTGYSWSWIGSYSLPYYDYDVTPGTKYYYEVYANNDCGYIESRDGCPLSLEVLMSRRMQN